MKSHNYSVTLQVDLSQKEVYKLVKDVSKWWGRNFRGSTANLEDEFVIRHGDHYSRHKLIEDLPFKRLVWLITESQLNWLEKNPFEWTGTKMVFDITTKGHKTFVLFTHEGLVPGMECYETCAEGWNIIIRGWLHQLLVTGQDGTG